MISRLYFDLDECLIHSKYIPSGVVNEDSGYNFSFTLEDGEMYATFIRSFAQEAIDYARLVLGRENVFILTAATHEYAQQIDALAGFGFGPNKIFAREHWMKNPSDPSFTWRCPNSALIDNLPQYDNWAKCRFIGIQDEKRYFQIEDFFGVDIQYNYFEVVKVFIDSLIDEIHSEDQVATILA